jgi:hypothetical protein
MDGFSFSVGPMENDLAALRRFYHVEGRFIFAVVKMVRDDRAKV